MSAVEGTLLMTARSLTSHCSRCGRAWSIPSEIPDFEVQQRQIIDWFHEHLSTTCAAEVPKTPRVARSDANKGRSRLIQQAWAASNIDIIGDDLPALADLAVGALIATGHLPRVAVVRPTRDQDWQAIAKVLYDELSMWGFGDFHYGNQPRDEGVLAALAVYEAAGVAVSDSQETPTL